MTARRTAAALAVTLSLTLGLGACSKSDNGDVAAPNNGQSVAPGGSQAAGNGAGGQVHLGNEIDPGEAFRRAYEDNSTMKMTMDGKDTRATSHAEFEFDKEGRRMKTTSTSSEPGKGGSIILVPGAMYSKTGPSPKWMKMSTGSTASSSTSGEDDKFASMIQGDGPATFVREDTVNGEHMRVYHGKVRMVSGDKSESKESFPADLWVDDKGYLRKLDAKNAEVSPGQKGDVTITWNWGQPVDIQAPPESEVASQQNGVG